MGRIQNKCCIFHISFCADSVLLLFFFLFFFLFFYFFFFFTLLYFFFQLHSKFLFTVSVKNKKQSYSQLKMLFILGKISIFGGTSHEETKQKNNTKMHPMPDLIVVRTFVPYHMHNSLSKLAARHSFRFLSTDAVYCR